MNLQAGFLALAQDRTLTGQMYRVLFYLFSVLDAENETKVAHGDVSAALSITPENVSRIMKALIDRGYVVRMGKDGRFWRYRLDFELLFARDGRPVRKRKNTGGVLQLAFMNGQTSEQGVPAEMAVEKLLRLSGAPTMFDADAGVSETPRGTESASRK